MKFQRVYRSQLAQFNGWRCMDCGSLWAAEMFDHSQYESGFYSSAANYNRIKPAYDYTGPFVKKVFKAAKNGKVLDFGAGQGAAAAQLKSLGLDVHVLEPDKGYQELLKRDFDRVFSSLEEVSVKYDCIYGIGVLEHLSDIPSTIENSNEKLNKMGS